MMMMMINREYIREKMVFKGLKLTREEYEILCEKVELNFKQKGNSQFEAIMPGGRIIIVKFKGSRFISKDNCHIVKTMFRVSLGEGFTDYSRAISEIKTYLRRKEHFHKRDKDRKSKYGSRYDYKANTYST